MRVLRWAVVLAVALVLAAFAVSNRAMMPLGLWPLPDIVELPAYLAVFAALFLGFLAGEAAGWIAGHHRRREARHAARRIAALERELDAVRAEPIAATPPRLAG